jgi:hypothetical protein
MSMGEYEEAYGNDPPPPQPTKTVWVTRSGQQIKVRDMTNSHLINTVRYLRRAVHIQLMQEVISLGAYLETNLPDGAYSAALNAENDLLDMDGDDYLEMEIPTWPALLAEAKRRGLQL